MVIYPLLVDEAPKIEILENIQCQEGVFLMLPSPTDSAGAEATTAPASLAWLATSNCNTLFG